MQINLDLGHLIGEKEEGLLMEVLKCDDLEELQTAVTKISKAAIAEYLEMILGKQLPTRANEIRERKLFHLMKNYFGNRFPSESEVSSLFQLTESDSRTLLRNVKTKYRYELEEELSFSVKKVLLDARRIDGEGPYYNVVIQSDNLLEELKQVVSTQAPHLAQISKIRNSAGVYSISEDTFELLCNAYGIALSEDEVAPTRG